MINGSLTAFTFFSDFSPANQKTNAGLDMTSLCQLKLEDAKDKNILGHEPYRFPVKRLSPIKQIKKYEANSSQILHIEKIPQIMEHSNMGFCFIAIATCSP